jgi:hypothetical protein
VNWIRYFENQKRLRRCAVGKRATNRIRRQSSAKNVTGTTTGEDGDEGMWVKDRKQRRLEKVQNNQDKQRERERQNKNDN